MKKIILSAALTLAASHSALAQTPGFPTILQTNADGSVSINQTNFPATLPTANVLTQVESFFTSFNTNATIWADTTSAWIGADYVQGLNVAQSVGIEHDVWQSAALKTSIARGNNLNGYTFSLETVERNAGIGGTILTAGGGAGFNIIKNDLKITGFVEAEYNFLLRKIGAEFGARAKKALGVHEFIGAAISFETYRSVIPTINTHIGFTL